MTVQGSGSRPETRRKGAGTPAKKRLQPATGRVYLHRSVAVIRPGRIDIRPAVSAAALPLTMFLAGSGCFALVLFSAMGGNYPLWLVGPALLVALLLMPLAGMGFVYAVVGASVIIDTAKQSATWQQGLLGLGVGTRELVPFARIARIDVTEARRPDAAAGEERDEAVAQWDVVLVKDSGRRLTLATASVARPLRLQAYERVAGVAMAIAELTGVELRLPERV